MRDSVDYFQNPLMLGDPPQSRLHVHIDYVLLPLTTIFIDDQIMPRAVALALVTTAVGTGANGIALNPGSMQHT